MWDVNTWPDPGYSIYMHETIQEKLQTQIKLCIITLFVLFPNFIQYKKILYHIKIPPASFPGRFPKCFAGGKLCYIKEQRMHISYICKTVSWKNSHKTTENGKWERQGPEICCVGSCYWVRGTCQKRKGSCEII